MNPLTLADTMGNHHASHEYIDDEAFEKRSTGAQHLVCICYSLLFGKRLRCNKAFRWLIFLSLFLRVIYPERKITISTGNDWSREAENHNPATAKTSIYIDSPQVW
ncbi:uncharacterized protein LOC133896023 [Phragmites australis]|uniref:uncharacterized protein LOC133896023 n=1 Tax=Phragmites australis TaxID=29695 RepID=UPI002D767D0C|nr:uncharacterized protein LOC133896023 [Phragmites australis]